MTYREMYVQVLDLLSQAGIEDADAQSRLLLEYSAQKDLNFYLLHREDEMPEREAARFLALAKKRCRHIPLQYLTGEQEFMGHRFLVNAHVLIPRQDTETLAQEAIRLLGVWTQTHRSGEGGPARVLDLCTGSGCIAVSVKCACPDAVVSGCDLSKEAIATADGNAARNGAAVDFFQSDLFCAVEGSFDLIVSNPPYIPTHVLDTLMPEVRDHEPVLALDGGADGLAFHRRILAECGRYLRPGAYLLLEIGSDQADAVRELMLGSGLEEIRILRDLSGLDRVAAGRSRGHV